MEERMESGKWGTSSGKRAQALALGANVAYYVIF
jgi:hypothetical protein